MTEEQIFEKVKDIITADYLSGDDGKTTEVTMATSLKDINLDSLDVVEFVLKLETEFGISLPDEQAATLQTVKEIVETISAKLSGKE